MSFRDTRPVYPPEYDLPDAPVRCCICGRFLSNENVTGACPAPRPCAAKLDAELKEQAEAEADAYAAELEYERGLIAHWRGR